MVFNSVEFFVLLAVVGTLYWRLRGRSRLAVLLVGSYVFYGWWDVRFLSLIVISTIVDFAVGLGIDRSDDDRTRKRLLWVSVVVNLGILGFFKYWNFFVDSAVEALGAVGLEPSAPTLSIVLPVGISFYTFQTMSYSFDIYRRRLEPTSDPLVFAVYVAYFPQLVAGPIERAHALLPQIRSLPPTLLPFHLRTGVALIVRGLAKKVIIADTAAGVANRYFGAADGVGTLGAAAAILAFAVQIYGDFSGYTDIARGTSRLLGIELKRNFAQPYLSRNITEFWQRWHISLSDWLRDYLYIPLGGNRRGARRTYVNLMITMLLGGLWHGASGAFVLWGAYHGALLAIHRAWRPGSSSDDRLPTAAEVPRVAATFAAVCIGWVVFRAQTVGDGFEILAELARPVASLETAQDLVVVIGLALAMLVGDIVERVGGIRYRRADVPAPAVGALTGLVLVGVLVASSQSSPPFIYFQF